MTTRIPALLALLALSTTACDAVEDHDIAVLADDDDADADADAIDALAADEYEDPPMTARPVAEPDYVDNHAEAEAPTFAPLDIAAELHPTALCFFYSQKAAATLTAGGVTYGTITLQTNCGAAYARTTVTNPSVYNWEHRIKVSIQYWNGATWINWQTRDNWSTLPGFTYSDTTPTNFAIGTYVRACGQIESALLVGSTPYLCAPFFQISSAS